MEEDGGGWAWVVEKDPDGPAAQKWRRIAATCTTKRGGGGGYSSWAGEGKEEVLRRGRRGGDGCTEIAPTKSA